MAFPFRSISRLFLNRPSFLGKTVNCHKTKSIRTAYLCQAPLYNNKHTLYTNAINVENITNQCNAITLNKSKLIHTQDVANNSDFTDNKIKTNISKDLHEGDIKNMYNKDMEIQEDSYGKHTEAVVKIEENAVGFTDAEHYKSSLIHKSEKSKVNKLLHQYYEPPQQSEIALSPIYEEDQDTLVSFYVFS